MMAAPLLNPPALQVLTNDTLRAPAHRVLSPAKQPRFSAPYHFSPARQVGQGVSGSAYRVGLAVGAMLGRAAK